MRFISLILIVISFSISNLQFANDQEDTQVLSELISNDKQQKYPVISRVLFHDFNNGEFFSIFNPTSNYINIENWSATDGEGTIFFKNMDIMTPFTEIVIARNAESYETQHGYLPDYSILPNKSGCPIVSTDGSFRLNNEGDEILMFDAQGEIIDAVLFGELNTNRNPGEHWIGPPVPSPGNGRLIQRQIEEGVIIDTNTRDDWLSLREYKPGQSLFPPFHSDAKATPLLLPEHSNLVIEQLASTKESLLICSYEFDSIQIWSIIDQLLDRGIDIKILLEGAPVGGLSEHSKALLSLLEKRGASICLMARKGDSFPPRRYAYLHSKYMVIDDHTSIIMTENLVSDVFDTELGRGNRGWAVILKSREVADHLNSLFYYEIDDRFTDIMTWMDYSDQWSFYEDILELPTTALRRVIPLPPKEISCEVEISIFPDCTRSWNYLSELINWTQRAFYAEIFYADLYWGTWSYGTIANPVTEAVSELSEKCEEFVICFDNSWYSEERENNHQIINRLSNEEKQERNDYFVGYSDENAPFDMIHNKGFVLDNQFSWISSLNWNYASSCTNREIGIMIDSPIIAEFYERCILTDIYGDSIPPKIELELEREYDSTDWMLRLSDDSDETGLRSVSFRTDDGNLSSWELMIEEASRNVQVKIRATDLWGNSASKEVMIFPDKQAGIIVTGSAQLPIGSGMIISISSAIGMLILIPSVRRLISAKLLQLLNFMNGIVE